MNLSSNLFVGLSWILLLAPLRLVAAADDSSSVDPEILSRYCDAFGVFYQPYFGFAADTCQQFIVTGLEGDEPIRFSSFPSDAPSLVPSFVPSTIPSDVPSLMPSTSPSDVPTPSPSLVPSDAPSSTPSAPPSFSPTMAPSPPPSLLSTAEGGSDGDSEGDDKGISSGDGEGIISEGGGESVSLGEGLGSSAPSLLPSGMPSPPPSRMPSPPPSGMPTSAPSVPPGFVNQAFSMWMTILEFFRVTVTNVICSVLPICPATDVTGAREPGVSSSFSSDAPNSFPSTIPSLTPSAPPSDAPSLTPSAPPSDAPSLTPSAPPSDAPSLIPNAPPSDASSDVPLDRDFMEVFAQGSSVWEFFRLMVANFFNSARVGSIRLCSALRICPSEPADELGS